MFALYGGHYFDFNRRYDTASATVHCNNIQIYSQGGFEHIYELPFLRFKKICSMNSNSATQYPGYLGEPSKPKNGEKHDIVQKGGRGLDQNPSFKLSRKNDMSSRGEGAMV